MNCPYFIQKLLADGDFHAIPDVIQPVMIALVTLVTLAFWLKRKWWQG